MDRTIDMDWAFKQLDGRSVPDALMKIATRLRVDAGRFIEVVKDTPSNWDGDICYVNSDPAFFWAIHDENEYELWVKALTYVYGEPVKKKDGGHQTFFVLHPLTRQDIFALKEKGAFIVNA